MDGIANVARQQQSQVNPQTSQEKVIEQMQATQHISQSQMHQDDDGVKQMQDTSSSASKEINSQKDIDDLVKKLNEAISPLNTNVKFGVDQNDIFYVAAFDSKTDKMIRRFPAKQAQDFLPKMQEVTGILFDSKG